MLWLKAGLDADEPIELQAESAAAASRVVAIKVVRACMVASLAKFEVDCTGTVQTLGVGLGVLASVPMTKGYTRAVKCWIQKNRNFFENSFG
jgi:hypothetical protein